jgi:hypothetical protein
VIRKPEGKRTLGKNRCDDNIKMDIIKIRWEAVNSINMVQERDDDWVVNTVMNQLVPQVAGNFLTRSVTLSLSSRNSLHGISYREQYIC